MLATPGVFFHFRKRRKNRQKGHFEKNRKKRWSIENSKKKGDTFQNPKHLVRILDFSPKLKNTLYEFVLKTQNTFIFYESV